MRLRYWASVVRSGTEILGELPMTGDVSFSHRFGGGTFSGSVWLGDTLDDGTPNWSWLDALENLTRPGMRTIVVTDDAQHVLGEWIVTQRQTSTDEPAFALSGIQWETYPSWRSLNARYNYKSVQQLQIAHDLLAGAYNGLPITVPTPTSTVKRTVEWRSRSGYFADAIADIADAENGFEWLVDISGVWDGDQLVGVNRDVVFGEPVLARASSVVCEAGEPGTRHGNATISGGEDFARHAMAIGGGAVGKGDKQLWSEAVDWSGLTAGYLTTSRHTSYPGTISQSVLDSLVRAELAAAQSIRDPWEVTARIDDLAELPRVGHQVRLVSPRSWGFPSGIDATLRVAWRADGHTVTTVDLKAA
jgi:hypothetical protein